MPKQPMSDVLPASKTVQIDGKSVEVKKLSLRQIISLSRAIQDIPKEFLDGADQKDNAAFIKEIPMVLMELLPKYSELVSETLDGQISGEAIQNADIDELFDLVEAFLEINNIPKVMERVGKVKALAVGAKA